MFDEFSRNASFFQNKARLPNRIIIASDIDNAFNDIGQYLNNILKPVIDNLGNTALGGIAGLEGSFLQNTGDESLSTYWDYLTSANIDNYSLSFKKFALVASSSILAADDNGTVQPLTSLASNQILVADAQNRPQWQILAARDITGLKLTGEQLGTLQVENFTENLLINDVPDNSIETHQIQDSAITNDKLIDGSITAEKLGIFPDLPLNSAQIKPASFADGAIPPTKIADGTIRFSYFNTPKPLTRNHLAQFMLTDAHLKPYYGSYTTVPTNLKSVGGLRLLGNYKLSREHIVNDTLDKHYFTADVRKAMEFFGA